MDVETALRAHGGLAKRATLRSMGISDSMISTALARGVIERPRNGWFVLQGTDARIIAAVRVGGSVGCRTALRAHGVWALDDEQLHIEVRRNSARLRSPSDKGRPYEKTAGVRVHWTTESRPWVPVSDVVTALRCFSKCAHPDELVCALDSALNLRMIHQTVAENLLSGAIADVGERPALDALSESGLETLARIRLARLGITSISQVKVFDIARLDLLIGDRLNVELDGRTWHEKKDQRAKDAARDAALTALGFVVLRFTFAQVIYDWDAVEAAILRVIADGGHLTAPRK
jgi:very-short-patch-repair endonuclease